MRPYTSGVMVRTLTGLRALTQRGLGRSSLFAAAAAPFFAVRSPGAALLFVLLPAYAVLLRGDFSASSKDAPEGKGPDAAVSPAEIPARLAAALLAAAASLAALTAGSVLARRFTARIFPTPWGLAVAGAAAALTLAAVHLPFLAAGGRRPARTAGGVVFASAGILAAVSALRSGSLYAAFLWLLYSGEAPGLYFPLLGATGLLALLSGALSTLIARIKRAPPRQRKEGGA